MRITERILKSGVKRLRDRDGIIWYIARMADGKWGPCYAKTELDALQMKTGTEQRETSMSKKPSATKRACDLEIGDCIIRYGYKLRVNGIASVTHPHGYRAVEIQHEAGRVFFAPDYQVEVSQ